MTDDAQLLRCYASEASEPAFAEFVERHIRWVYHAGLRRTGGRHDLAQEISHYVFTAAARNAERLSRRTSVTGWLYVTARYAAYRVLRGEARRRNYETAALAMNETESAANSADWEQLRPALDEVLDRLPSPDRETLLLRFFEGLGFKQIGTALNVTEDAARKRVERALEKLRRVLARRGVTSSSSALAALLATKVNAAVAIEFQAAVTTAALSGAALPGASILGVLHFMNATNITSGGVGLLASLIFLIVGGVALNETLVARAAEESLANARRQYAEASARLDALDGSPMVAASPASLAQPPPAGKIETAQIATMAATRDQKRADGQAFLNSFNGRVREQYRERIQQELQQKFALFFSVSELDQQKQRALITAMAQQWEQTLEVTPKSIVPGVVELPEQKMRAILGDDGYRQWHDFKNRADTANRWVMNVAKHAGDRGQPLSLNQLAALQSVVCEASPEYRAGGKVNDRTVAWATVYRESQTFLTPAQWQAAQPFLLMRQAMHSLEAHAQAEATASPTALMQ